MYELQTEWASTDGWIGEVFSAFLLKRTNSAFADEPAEPNTFKTTTETYTLPHWSPVDNSQFLVTALRDGHFEIMRLDNTTRFNINADAAGASWDPTPAYY